MGNHKKRRIKSPRINKPADQDSDFFYVSNQPDLVECARRAYANYSTVVNNIPMSSKCYDNTPESQASVDSQISSSRISIGSSSNVSQICQSYDCSYHDQKYSDYCCILAVLAQVAIDSAKKSFAINVSDEIEYIKQDIDIESNGYPVFWRNIQPAKADHINYTLTSPMCELSRMKVQQFMPATPTLPMETFFVNYPLKPGWRASKKIEKLIEDFSFKEYLFNRSTEDDKATEFLLLRDDFENLVQEIRSCCLPEKYIGLVSWLLNRAFVVSHGMKTKEGQLQTKMNKNKAALLSVLYEVSPNSVLKCFSKNVKNDPKAVDPELLDA